MKRQRPVNSCLACRKRRVRCDKVRPACYRCRTARIECGYDHSALVESSRIIAASTVATTALLIEPSLPGAAGSSYASGPERLQIQCETQESPSRRPWEKGQFFAEHGGRSSYVGSTFWANPIHSEFNRFNQENADFPSRFQVEGHMLDFANTRPGALRFDETRWPKVNSSQCKFCGDRYKLSCIVTMLPDKETCEKLCDLFFATVFPLTPLLHLPSFATDFRIFWEETDLTTRHDSESGPFVRRNPGFVCLISSILFAALASLPLLRLKNILGADNHLAPGDMYFAAAASASLTGFPRSPSLYTLAAYIFVQSQFVREEDFPDSQDFISTAFRIALGMGLHRQLPEAGFSVAELETRRRIWWYILHLDAMLSASSGLSPLFIDEKMANTDMISPYFRYEGVSGQEPHQADVRYLVASLRYEITKEIRVILRLHFEDAFQTLDQVNDIAKRLKTASERLSKTIPELLPKANSRPSHRASVVTSRGDHAESSNVEPKSFARIWKVEPDGDDQDVASFCSWSAILLHLMVHKAYCILYHPLFRDPAMVSNISVRENAVKHAQAFLQLFIRVCDDPVSEPFHWMYPGTYQPLQAVSLLLADLLQFPHADEALESRGLVDAVFDLYQADEGMVCQNSPPKRKLSSSGKDAWSILSRTRKKALAHIGQDHYIFIPSRKVFSDFCICGERISRNRPRACGDQGSVSEQRHTLTSLANFHDAPADNGTLPANSHNAPGDHGLSPASSHNALEDHGPTPGPMFMGNAEFDWQEWDYSLGMSTGMLP